jgi:hypothetical protein
MQVWLLLVVYIHSCAVTGDLVTCHQHIVKLALNSVCIDRMPREQSEQSERQKHNCHNRKYFALDC